MTVQTYPRARACAAALAAALTLAGAATAHAATPQQRVDQAIRAHNRPAVLRLLRQHNPAVDRALFRHAKVRVTNTGSLTFEKMLTTTTSYGSGCHYTAFSSKHSIQILGMTVGSQKITEWGYCWTASWNGGRIRWWGGHSASRTSFPGYCWTNIDSGDYFNPYPHWRTAWAYGQLGGSYIVGCLPLQSDRPHIDYAAGGGIFRH